MKLNYGHYCVLLADEMVGELCMNKAGSFEKKGYTVQREKEHVRKNVQNNSAR